MSVIVSSLRGIIASGRKYLVAVRFLHSPQSTSAHDLSRASLYTKPMLPGRVYGSTQSNRFILVDFCDFIMLAIVYSVQWQRHVLLSHVWYLLRLNV